MSGGHFEPMVRDLRNRGLIGSDNRLTAAGDAHAQQLIEQLRDAPPPPTEEPIFWNHSFKQRSR